MKKHLQEPELVDSAIKPPIGCTYAHQFLDVDAIVRVDFTKRTVRCPATCYVSAHVVSSRMFHATGRVVTSGAWQ